MNPEKDFGKKKQSIEDAEIVEETKDAYLRNPEVEEMEAVVEKSGEDKLFEMQQQIIEALKALDISAGTEEFLSQGHWSKPLQSVTIPKNHPLMPILDYAKKTSKPEKPIEFRLRELFSYPYKQEEPIPKSFPADVRKLLEFFEKSAEQHRPDDLKNPSVSKFGEVSLHAMGNFSNTDIPLERKLAEFKREALAQEGLY